MATNILSAEELEQLKCEIEEATMLIKTVVDLAPTDEATATTYAIEELARKAGWLLDRCTRRLGGACCNGAEWLDWCGGYPAAAEEKGAGSTSVIS